MKFDNQLRYAVQVIDSYNGEIPLHSWLKDFFRAHKQMGSRDRRLISNLSYGFYRLGHGVKGLRTEERLLTGLFLCHENPGELLAYFKPDWHESAGAPVEEKIEIVRSSGIGLDVEQIFPFKEQLSEGIDHRAFCLSFLQQPDLFLRIRPGAADAVRKKLGDAFDPAFMPPSSLRLPNGYKVEDHFIPDRSVVIQDLSSQRIAGFFPEAAPARCWDACAASGGKSILVADTYPGIEVTVSDIRESILANLRGRFARAGIGEYSSLVADLQVAGSGPQGIRFDLILGDVPCTGSGTWSRTPEDLYFFDPARIAVYSAKQQRIAGNIVSRLSKGGRLVYITCSVFRQENEAVAAILQERYGLRIEQAGVIPGYQSRADSMYAARLVAD